MKFPELLTERLKLRQIRMGDAKALYKYKGIQGDSPYPRVDTHESLAISQRLIQRKLKEYYSQLSFTWAITLLPSDTLIGIVSLTSMEKLVDYPDFLQTHRMEISCSLNPANRKKGIMTEARIAIIGWRFDSDLTFERIHSEVSVLNESSLKMNEKLGFKRDGIFRCHEKKAEDIVILSLTRKDYETHPIYEKKEG